MGRTPQGLMSYGSNRVEPYRSSDHLAMPGLDCFLHQPNLKGAKAHVCFWDLCYCVSPLANEFVIARLLFIPCDESFKRIFLLLIAPE